MLGSFVTIRLQDYKRILILQNYQIQVITTKSTRDTMIQHNKLITFRLDVQEFKKIKALPSTTHQSQACPNSTYSIGLPLNGNINTMKLHKVT
jgi:hypothetical protein